VPGNASHSITEQVFDYAVGKKKPVLAFVVTEN